MSASSLGRVYAAQHRAVLIVQTLPVRGIAETVSQTFHRFWQLHHAQPYHLVSRITCMWAQIPLRPVRRCI